MTSSSEHIPGTDAPQSAGPTWLSQVSPDGEFQRRQTQFRKFVSEDGELRPERDRYHLYVSLACPWAHRTLIVRKLLGLEDVVTFDVVDHLLPTGGWTLSATSPGATLDTVNGQPTLRAIYELAAPGYAGSVTVPVLWDRATRTIVNNESAEIIRMFGSAFRRLGQHPELDLYPEELRERIDGVNGWVYELLNNGVYRAGFARSQAAYEHAVTGVFEALDRVESLLRDQRYLAGDRLTEADVRLFTTLVRFDAVYVGHFKCNVRRLVDYPNTWSYTRELFSLPAFRETTNFEHIKRHYYESHEALNPHRIVPVGPLIDFAAPHDRARLAARWPTAR